MTPLNPTPPIDEELGALLRNRPVPAPAADFWATLDAELDAADASNGDSGSGSNTDGDDAGRSADTDDPPVQLIDVPATPADELAVRRNRLRSTRFMAVAAALLLLAGSFAIFRNIAESSAPSNIAVQPGDPQAPDAPDAPDAPAQEPTSPDAALRTEDAGVITAPSPSSTQWADWTQRCSDVCDPSVAQPVATGGLLAFEDGPNPTAYAALQSGSANDEACEDGTQLVDAVDLATATRSAIVLDDGRHATIVPGPMNTTAVVFGCRDSTEAIHLVEGDLRTNGPSSTMPAAAIPVGATVIDADWQLLNTGQGRLILTIATPTATGFDRQAYAADFEAGTLEPFGENTVIAVAATGPGMLATLRTTDSEERSFFDTPTGVQVELQGRFNSLDWSPNSDTFVASGDSGFVVVDASGFVFRSKLDGPAWEATFSPAGDAIVYSGSDGLRVHTLLARSTDLLLDPFGHAPVFFTDSGLSIIYAGLPNGTDGATVRRMSFDAFTGTTPEPAAAVQASAAESISGTVVGDDLAVADDPVVADGLGGSLTGVGNALVHVRADGSQITLVEPWGSFGPDTDIVQHWLTDIAMLDGEPHALVREFKNNIENFEATDFQDAILAINLVTDTTVEVERRFIDTIESFEWMYSGHITSDGTDLLVERQLFQGQCVWAEKLAFPSGDVIVWAETPLLRPAIDGLTDADATAIINGQQALAGCIDITRFNGLSLGTQAELSTLDALNNQLAQQS